MFLPRGIPCRFGDGEAMAVYDMDEGCFCYPDDRQQALCAQHIVKATPLGTMKLAGENRPGILEEVFGS